MRGIEMKKFTLPLPKNYALQSIILSHGWSELKPMQSNEEHTALQTVVSLSLKRHVYVRFTEQSLKIYCTILHPIALSAAEQKQLRNIAASMFRLNESFDEFYALCKQEATLRWIPSEHAGRMLRSQTVFEDIVKMMCTTNCSWSLTKIMVNNLTEKLGMRVTENVYTFPTPEAIAKKSEQWLRKNISCGYRAPYLLELCKKISNGTLEVESLRNSTASTEEMYAFLRSIKGIGHYAAGNLLKLLGRYDYLGIDSWVRKQFSEVHCHGRTIDDAKIEKHYSHYGSWRGLVCWMEVTKNWYV